MEKQFIVRSLVNCIFKFHTNASFLRSSMVKSSAWTMSVFGQWMLDNGCEVGLTQNNDHIGVSYSCITQRVATMDGDPSIYAKQFL